MGFSVLMGIRSLYTHTKASRSSEWATRAAAQVAYSLPPTASHWYMALQDPRRSSEPSWRAAVGSSSADGIRRAKLARLALAAAVVCLGLGLGLGLPSERRPSGSCPASISGGLSGVLGWTYFAAWSASFYPQAIQNYVRRSVVGLSFDFALLNLIAFGCYSAFNLALFLSPTVQAEYAAAHHSSSAVGESRFNLHIRHLSYPARATSRCHRDLASPRRKRDRTTRTTTAARRDVAEIQPRG